MQNPAVVVNKKDTIRRRGGDVSVTGLRINGNQLMVEGKFLSVARLKDEWYTDIDDPELVINMLKKRRPRPDLFTFWQRLPDTVARYPYQQELVALSAIPLKDFQHWWHNQIKTDTRKKVKRPEKRGIEIKVVSLDDEFVRGVREVFNETPVRRGRRFWHYGKDIETIKANLSRDMERSKFIGAYHEGSLVGFVKLVYAEGRFANPGLIVSKLEFRKKYVNNALLAKAVELCINDGLPYLTYTDWRKGAQSEFLMRHGFQKQLVPRYWIPLTKKGAIAMHLGLHCNLRRFIPDYLLECAKKARAVFYSKWYNLSGGQGGNGD